MGSLEGKTDGFNILILSKHFLFYSLYGMGDSYQIKDQSAPHFITCQVVGWADVFSRQAYRDIIIESLRFCVENKDLIIYAYVIMTNHIHLLVRSNGNNLSDIIRDFKRFTANRILYEVEHSIEESRKEWLEMIFEYYAKYNKRADKRQFWTHENHAVELSTNDMIDSRLDHIHENPVKAGWVEKPEDYLYSSARNYAGLNGMLDVEVV